MTQQETIEVSRNNRTQNSNWLSTLVYDTWKRLFDILGSLALLTLAVPVMMFLSFIVRLSSPGPAIYCQRRLTAGRRIFTIFKFRTMRSDAETTSGAVWASKDDPRVTKIGKFMRKTRLDELPQLMNVLIGDMSLIGPRPERPEIAISLQKEFPNFMKRCEVPAGLTGLAQVSSGYADSVDSYKDKLKHDLEYVEQRSLLLDFKIILKTVLVVLTGDGAR